MAKKSKVFIFSDSLIFSSIMIDILSKLHYEVEQAEDAETGLNKIKSFHPDLVFLDMDILPKTEGIKLIKAIKANPLNENVNFFVTHSYDDPQLEKELNELGVEKKIEKPISEEALVLEINQFFGKEEVPTTEVFEEYHKTFDVEPFLPKIDSKCGRIRLWGTRGSIPISKQEYTRHGGNTSCVEVRGDDEIFILDAGSGIVELGNELAKGPPRSIHILITHTHWDHIQGFPFFYPAFIPGFEITVYGPSSLDSDLSTVLKDQQNRDYFPVQFDSMNATVNFVNTGKQTSAKVGDFTVSWEHTYHPGASVGYKIEGHGRKIAYLGDNEFLPGYQGTPHGITKDSFLVISFKDLINFIKDVDVLISEAQYTNDEYRNKIGWGHTSVSNGCLLAKLGNVKKWIVIHHDPTHDDKFLQNKLILTKQIMQEIGHPIDVVNAYDGMIEYF